MKTFEIGAKKTQVFFLHGLRGHGLSQKAALQNMVKNLGIQLLSLELPGHGEESTQRHCLVPPYEILVADIVEEIKRNTLDVEQVIVMGYSFGAALMILAAQSLEKDPNFKPTMSGVIGISTAFDVGHNVPRWQLGLSKAIAPISRFLFEKAWRLSNVFTIHEMNVSLISSDKVVRDAIQADPLVYKGRIPLATSAQVYRAGLAAKHAVKDYSLPTLLLHSKDDSIALPPAENDFTAHVQLKLFNFLRHNCIDGVLREVIIARRTIMQFIVTKL
ncbi:MAG: lysophospholipase [Acidiferrobacterales bacterium]|nr:lysophospholipase [Acidiferrobacterales bacterium]